MRNKNFFAIIMAGFIALQNSCPVFAQNKNFDSDSSNLNPSLMHDSNKDYLISILKSVNSKLDNGKFYIDPNFDYSSVSRSVLDEMAINLESYMNKLNSKNSCSTVLSKVNISENANDARTLVDLAPPYCVDFDMPSFGWASTDITGAVYLNYYRDDHDNEFKIRNLESASTWVTGLQFPITFDWDCRFIDYGEPYDNGKKASLFVEGVVTASLIFKGCPLRYDYTKKIDWTIHLD